MAQKKFMTNDEVIGIGTVAAILAASFQTRTLREADLETCVGDAYAILNLVRDVGEENLDGDKE